MATTNLTGTQFSSGRVTLAANTEDIVNAPAQWSHVQIISDGTDWLFVRLDGTAATVDGKNCFAIPAAVSVLTIAVPTSGATHVSLISPGTTKYVVQQLPDRIY